MLFFPPSVLACRPPALGLLVCRVCAPANDRPTDRLQVLEVMEFMSDATTIPILLDADTGYGNFNNARILVKKLEQRGTLRRDEAR